MPGDAVNFEEVSAIFQGVEQDVIEVARGSFSWIPNYIRVCWS
jgi:hypothetical protein